MSDGLHKAFQTARLHLNSAVPSSQFQLQPLMASVAESSPIGTSLGILQADGGKKPYRFGIGAKNAENVEVNLKYYK